MLRRLMACAGLLVLVSAPPALAQASVLTEAASRLRADPVFVHPEAERAIAAADADEVRARIRASGVLLYVAVLPARVVNEPGVDAARLAEALAARTGLAGSYAVFAGDTFRAASNEAHLAPAAGGIAKAAFDAERARGTRAVLDAFVDRLGEASRTLAPPRPITGPVRGVPREEPTSLVPVAVVGAAVALALVAVLVVRRRRAAR